MYYILMTIHKIAIWIAPWVFLIFFISFNLMQHIEKRSKTQKIVPQIEVYDKKNSIIRRVS